MLSLIVNPSSGGGRAGAALPGVQAELGRLGLEFSTTLTRSLGHARELALEAASGGAAAVALGGDGLVGAVAGALSGTDGVLGVLPGGRGNDFARVLGIPLEPIAACAVLAGGASRAVDLGRAAPASPHSPSGLATAGAGTSHPSGIFIGIASCGFDSEANRIANQTRLVRGNLVYAYGALRALVSWKPARFSLILDGEPVSMTGYTVAIANSAAYGGGMMLAPDASLDDGEFDVVLISQASRLSFLRSLPKVFEGAHVALPSVQVLRARHVEVSADRPFTMYADGDPIAELPVTVSVLPGAVRVLVPAGAGPAPPRDGR